MNSGVDIEVSGMEIELIESLHTYQITDIRMDIIDFTALCYEGSRKNTALFDNLLKVLKEVNEEEANPPKY